MLIIQHVSLEGWSVATSERSLCIVKGSAGFSGNEINEFHMYIITLQIGKVTSVITQNVDRLHHKAGSENVIELHGTGNIVKCLKCPYEIERAELQDIMMRSNPSMESSITMIRPDGDVELSKVSNGIKVLFISF